MFVKLASFLLLFWGTAEACIRGGTLRRRVPKEEPPLVYKQHVPNEPELSPRASGKRGFKVFAQHPRFKKLIFNDNKDIVFRDEEMRRLKDWMEPHEDHYMTLRCKEKLDYLSLLVKNTWKNTRLRVIEAWDQTGHHAADSLHYEGRAVDVTTFPRDRRKLGQLARFAVMAGFDWSYYESRAHVHASCKSDSAAGQTRAFRCFPSSARALLDSGRWTTMSDLRVGDRVQVLDPTTKRLKFSPVLLFLDRDPSISVQFLQLQLDNSSNLQLSPDHLVPIDSGDFKFARELRIGDRLLQATSTDSVAGRAIRSIRRLHLKGIFAPLTAEGTILVDNVTASCFAAVGSQDLAQTSLAPMRFWARVRHFLGWKDLGADSGLHWYASILLNIAEWLEKFTSLTILG